jgi:hypothetical protein
MITTAQTTQLAARSDPESGARKAPPKPEIFSLSWYCFEGEGHFGQNQFDIKTRYDEIELVGPKGIQRLGIAKAIGTNQRGTEFVGRPYFELTNFLATYPVCLPELCT